MIDCKGWSIPLMRGLGVAIATILLAIPKGNASPISYNVTVDTSSVSGTSGFLDFQFNPGDVSSQAATAAISSFINNGTLMSGPFVDGSISGTLPGTVLFNNNKALNEYFQQLLFGSKLSFVLTLDGPVLASPDATADAGTTFGIGVYDQSQNPILTNQGATTGFAGKVDVFDGGAQTTAYANATSPSVVSFNTNIAATPEPNTLVLCGIGLVGLAFERRHAARKRHS